MSNRSACCYRSKENLVGEGSEPGTKSAVVPPAGESGARGCVWSRVRVPGRTAK